MEGLSHSESVSLGRDKIVLIVGVLPLALVDAILGSFGHRWRFATGPQVLLVEISSARNLQLRNLGVQQ